MSNFLFQIKLVQTILFVGFIARCNNDTKSNHTMDKFNEHKSEIILTIPQNIGIEAISGKFSSDGEINVDKANSLLKEYNGVVKIIESEKSGSITEDRFYIIFIEKNPTEMLSFLKSQSWVESAYLKPASEDPGQF